MNIKNLNIEKVEGFDDHEMVSFFYDEETGLRGFIAIHNTNLGTPVGGTRMMSYKSEEEALKDALKLSRAMTFKCALANVSFGGGKSVIVGDPKKNKKPNLLRAYGKKLNNLNGGFYTGQDAGINSEDVKVINQESDFLIGKLEENNNLGYWTAEGVYFAIKASLKDVYGDDSLADKVFAIKGLGKVGGSLADKLHNNGANLIVADINKNVVESFVKNHPGVKVVPVEEIHMQKVNVYSPNALGGDISKKTATELNCDIVCGGANNQLTSEKEGEYLYTNNITYIPDYIANAGGLINVVDELEEGCYNQERVRKRIANILNTTREVLEISKKEQRPVNFVANELAKNKVYANKKQ